MKTGIYKIVSIKTNRVYVGSGVNISRRWSRHKRDLLHNKHHSSFLQRHYNKYGLKDLQFYIIEECDKDILLEREQYYLDTIECVFNNAKIAGSCLGTTRNQDFKIRISELTKGSNNPTFGLERTQEWRDNISKANKGQKAWNKGKTNIYSEETLEKMRNSSLKIKKMTCEYCKKEVSPPNYSRWHGENCKQKKEE